MKWSPARLFHTFFRPAPRSRPFREHRRLRLEQLEDRLALATWVGGGYAADPHGTSDSALARAWSYAGNWFGGVPGPGDTATFTHNITYTVIDNIGVSHTVTGPATDPNLDGSYSIGALQIDSSWGGSLDSSAVSNSLTFGGDSQFASGQVGLQQWINNGTLTIAGGAFGSGGTITNNGTVIQTGTLGVNTATLNNASGAVWDLQDDSNISFVGLILNPSTVNNDGTFRKSTGTGTSAINGAGLVAFNNAADGIVDVRSGTLTFQTANSQGGTLLISPGAVIEPDSLVGGAGSGPGYSGTYTVSGGGSVQLVAGQVLNVGPTPVTFDFDAGSFQWVGGTIQGQGGITINGSMDFSGNVVLATTLTNGGTITETGGSIYFQGVLNNPAGHLFDMQTDVGLGGSSGAMNNAGTFLKSGGSGTVTLHPMFNNNGGTIDVESGTLELLCDFQYGGGSGTGGNIIVAAGDLLELDTPYAGFNLSGTWTGSGAGHVQLNTDINVGTAGATFDFAPGMLQWTGGVIQGQGGITIDGAMDITSGVALETTLTNGGTINETGGSINFQGGVLDNTAGHLFDLQTDAGLGGSGGTINNAGTFRKSGGSGTVTVHPVFNNNGGAIDVESGTLELACDFQYGGGSGTGGAIIVAAGDLLELDTPYAGFNLSGTWTGSGSGHVQLNTDINVGSAGATFDFAPGMLQWAGGIIQGQGGITIDGAMDITAGVVLETTLTNSGTINETGGGINFQGGVLNNPAGQLFDIQTDAGLGGSGGTINNAGTFRKSGGSGTVTVHPVFNNNGGAIDVESGTLELACDFQFGGGSGTGGNFIVAAGDLLELDTPYAGFNFSGTWTGSGAGHVQLLNTSINIGAAGATFNFPPDLVQWMGATISGQTSGGGLTNAGSLTLTGGALVDTTLTNTGTIVETSGGLGFNGGVLDNAASGLFDMQTDASLGGPPSGTVNNAGTFRKSGGSGTASLHPIFNNNGGTIDVESGTLDLLCDSQSGGFSNTGVVQVGSGTLSIVTPFVNQVSGGTLTGGTWIVSSGATLSLPNVSNFSTNNATVTLSGPDSNFTNIIPLAVNNGTFNLLAGRSFTTAGDMSNTDTLTVGAGSILIVSGNFTQSAAATLRVALAGSPVSGQFGHLAVTGQAALDGSLAVSLANGFVPSSGQTFPVLSFAGHSGAFSTITGLSVGGVPLLIANLNPTNLTLSTAPADHLTIHGNPGQVIAGGAFGVTVDAEAPIGQIDTTYDGSATLLLGSGPAVGQLSGTTNVTFRDGVATFNTLSLNAIGNYTLIAASTGDLIADSATLSVVAAPQFKVTLTPVNAGSGQTFSAKITAMLNGNPDTAYLGTVQLTSSDPQAVSVPGVFKAGGNGTITLPIVLDTAGTQTVTVADTTLPGDKATSNAVTVTGLPLGLDHFIVSGVPATDVVNVPHTVTITAVNKAGQTDTNFSSTVTLTDSISGFTPLTVTFAKGVDKTPVTLTTQGTQTLTASGIGATGTEANIVVVSPATLLGIATSAPIVAGKQLTLTITGLVAKNKTDKLFDDTLQVTTSDPLAQVSMATSANGVETFNITFFTAGPQTITVTDVSRSTIKGITQSVAVSAAPFSQLAVTNFPLFAVAGAPASITVTAEDRFGNQVLSNVTDKVTLSPTLNFTFKPSDHGKHVFTTTFTAAGTQTLTAKDSTNSNVTSSSNVDKDVLGSAVQVVTTDPTGGSGQALIVVAPAGGGTILLTPVNAAGTMVSVVVSVGTRKVSSGTFTLAATDHIIVYGQAGNDVVTEMPAMIGTTKATITVPAILLGGSGTNTLSAAGSSVGNVLVGGPGKDSLTGGSGHDILIGGGGADTLRAGSGGDVLIGGSTIFDANLIALAELMAEWSSGDSYETRVQDLFGTGTGGQEGTSRLDDSTVINDAATNQLIGGGGMDWFWLEPGTDKVSDVAAGEVVSVK